LCLVSYPYYRSASSEEGTDVPDPSSSRSSAKSSESLRWPWSSENDLLRASREEGIGEANVWIGRREDKRTIGRMVGSILEGSEELEL
jgi:hypothetical protein